MEQWKNIELRKKDSIKATINSDEIVDYTAFGNYLPLDLAVHEYLIGADCCYPLAQLCTLLWHGQRTNPIDFQAK